jgi:isocitrate/isopropylmalate dehydrogenase
MSSLTNINADQRIEMYSFMIFFSLPGNIETGSLSRGVLSRNVALRNELDLFINVLHCKSYPGVTARHKDIDIIILRQNTEGEYAMLEHEVSMSCFSENKVSSIFVHPYFQEALGVRGCARVRIKF